MADEHHGTKELASAIRAGAERRPEQAFGDYFVGRRASCALGAAYEGIYRLASDMSGQRPTKDLTTFFDCLPRGRFARVRWRGARSVSCSRR